MNGAESLIKTLINNGVDVCFTNPGTSEMHFVAALDEVEGMRCVLCLFEGVLSGAADGYARMARKPASTLLHLGPGLGNALANLHNARKGHSPIINIVGDHATYHLQYDAPLTSDIQSIAGAVSHWVHTSRSAADIAKDAQEAVQKAGRNQVATLILPADVSWSDNPEGAEPACSLEPQHPVTADRLDTVASLLNSDKRCVILIGGTEIDNQRGHLLGQIAKASGARLCSDVFPTRMARGAGTVVIDRLPYLAEAAIEYLEDTEALILVGVETPVSFFAYPGVPSEMAPPTCHTFQLADHNEDLDTLLIELVERLGADAVQPDTQTLDIPALPEGALDAVSAAQSLAHLLPENAIIVDEAATSSMPLYTALANARPHDLLTLTGGSIGFGLPAATGAAIACPDRKVICLEADGSAMYTIQSLWTMAREQLDIVVVIYNNRKYSILEMEFGRTGARGGSPGPKAASLLSIGDPDIDFVAIANGLGVSATRATTAAAFNAQLEAAINTPGPHLIDALVPTLF